MTIERKLTKTSGATSAPVYVEDVFSTTPYSGNSSSQTITNGIDLATKGGLVWLKSRSGGFNHYLFDTARGATWALATDTQSAQGQYASALDQFQTTGFRIGLTSAVNWSAHTFVSWTFRKQPKFFDVVQYTGNSLSNRAVSHNLGSVPGLIIVKTVNDTNGWLCYHRSLGATHYIQLNQNFAAGSSSQFWSNTAPTSTVFTVGTDSWVNNSGNTYIAYLFAHDAGGFGATGTDSVVFCGNYTGNGSTSGPSVTLGWEPQFVMIKNASSTGDWNIFDTARGIVTNGTDPVLYANLMSAEDTTNGNLIDLTSTGFTIKSANSQVNTSGNNYVFLAIRKNMK